MLAPGRHPLAGLVEVDESSLPLRSKDDPPAGGQGRSHDGKMLIVGAIEVNDGKPGRLRLAALDDYTGASLRAFIKQAIAPGSTAKTDGLSSYAGLAEVGHDPHVVGAMAAHIIIINCSRQKQSLVAVAAMNMLHAANVAAFLQQVDCFISAAPITTRVFTRSAPFLR